MESESHQYDDLAAILGDLILGSYVRDCVMFVRAVGSSPRRGRVIKHASNDLQVDDRCIEPRALAWLEIFVESRQWQIA